MYLFIFAHCGLGLMRDQEGAGAEPATPYRGLMIDTARHFLDVAAIKRTIDGMQEVGLNKLHWRLSENQAFSAMIPGLEEISQAGAF
jgi:hexosaminidase